MDEDGRLYLLAQVRYFEVALIGVGGGWADDHHANRHKDPVEVALLLHITDTEWRKIRGDGKFRRTSVICPTWRET